MVSLFGLVEAKVTSYTSDVKIFKRINFSLKCSEFVSQCVYIHFIYMVNCNLTHVHVKFIKFVNSIIHIYYVCIYYSIKTIRASNKT